MQRVYEINLCAGIAMIAGLASAFVLSLLAIVVIPTEAVLLTVGGALTVLLPPNLFLCYLNRRRAFAALRLPFPRRVFTLASRTLVGVRVVSLVYGFVALAEGADPTLSERIR